MIKRRRLAAFILALSPAMLFATPLVLEPTSIVSIPNASVPNGRFEIVDAVATDGNFLAMGASVHGDDTDDGPFTDIGVFVFERQTNGAWAFRQTLLTDRVGPGNETGLALRGNLLAAFANGRLY